MTGDVLQGLDVPRLKRMVIEKWQTGGAETLVKVMPRNLPPDPNRATGYCTSIKYVLGRTPEEMEQILGFKSGTKLSDGAGIYRVDPLPSAEQFAFRAYTYLPAGIPQIDGKVLDENYPPGAGAPQWELTSYPQSGLKLLAFVEPGQRFACRYDRLPSSVPLFMAGTGGQPR